MDPTLDPALFRDAPAALCLISAEDLRIAFATRDFEELLGVAAGSEAARLPGALLEACAESGRSRRAVRVAPVARRDLRRPVGFEVRPVFRSGSLTGWFCHAREGGSRSEADRERRILRGAIDQLPVGFLLAEAPSARILYANPAAEALLGYRPEATKPEDYLAYALFHPDGRRFALDEYPLLRALRGERLEHVELDVASGTGPRRSLDISAAPVREGDRIFGAVVVFSDSTERRVDEQQRLELLESVARDREHLGTVFAQAPVALAVFQGPEHRFEIANARYEEMVGRTALVGRSAREAFPELPPDQPLFATLEQGLQGERVEVKELHVPLVRDGARRDTWFHLVVEPLPDAAGRPRGSMVVATEVTEQVEARIKIEALREQAEAANRSKDEFLAMLGHELRNPLAPIVTALQLLRMRSVPGGETERALIERQVHHLLRLVDDLLDVSRVTRGKVELRRRPVELGEVLGNAIEQASPLLEERGHHLGLQIQPGLVVDGDPARLAQIVSNLLTNAAKYTPERGHIDVRALREGPVVRLEVQDDGMGMPSDLLPRVFDLFVQGHREFDRGQGGLGLGLAIVRSLVQLHGGTVEARSPGPGRGSTLTVCLPALEGMPREPQGAPSPRRPAEGPAKHRVLIVDDNVDSAYLLGEAVSSFGHEVRTRHDGPAALQVAAEFRPDVALLDLGLPVMDGFELARRLRARPDGHRLHLIAVTGYGQRVDRERSHAAGFDLHLVKPVDLEDVARILRELPPR